MAVLDFFSRTVDKLTDKLRSPYATRVSLSRMGDQNSFEAEQKRVSHFQRLYDYYINDEDEIKLYMLRSMRRTFGDEVLKQMFLPYFNITNRIINRICLAYKIPPERYIVVPQSIKGEERIPDPKMQKAHDNYQKLLSSSNINSKSKEWHRLAKLGDTCYVQVRYVGDKVEYEVFFPHQLSVVEDPLNYLEPLEVEYTEVSAGGKNKRIYWSQSEHWVFDEDDKPIPDENPWNGVNKYGVIPFLPVRLRGIENHWGEGDTQLVDANEKINILYVSSFDNALMQAHGQMVGINTKLKSKIDLGPRKLVQIDNLPGEAQADLKYIHPEPAIEACMSKIDWMIRTTAMMHGLPAASVSIDVKAESGAAKSIDNWELLEIREDDIEYLRGFENKLFDVSRTIWNFHVPAVDKINEDAVFGIDFVKPEAPMTKNEEIDYKKKLMEFGLWTPIDDMVDEDEGIDRETALSIIEENLGVRNQLNDRWGLGNIKLERPVDEGMNGDDQDTTR